MRHVGAREIVSEREIVRLAVILAVDEPVRRYRRRLLRYVVVISLTHVYLQFRLAHRGDVLPHYSFVALLDSYVAVEAF